MLWPTVTGIMSPGGVHLYVPCRVVFETRGSEHTHTPLSLARWQTQQTQTHMHICIAQYIDWGLLPRALLGVLALVCGNGYIVGINQIYDVSVDSVNKPYLPIAAGGCSGHDVAARGAG